MKACLRVGLLIALPIWFAIVGTPAIAHPHGAEVYDGPWLGVVAKNMDFARLEALDLQYGVEVTRVAPGGPADSAGIRPQDVLIELDGKPLYSLRRLRWLVRRTHAGKELMLKYVREKQVETAKVRIVSRGKGTTPRRHHKKFPHLRPDTYLSVSLQNMGDDLRRIFGVPEDSGVLVAEVFANSPAAEARLAAGDVIVKMDRKRIRDISDIYRVLDYFDPGEEIAVEIVRDKRTQTITVTLDKRPEGREFGDALEEGGEEDLHFFFDPESWRDEFESLLERWSRRHQWRERSTPPDRQDAL
jgi:S1-C subfamily serine protease